MRLSCQEQLIPGDNIFEKWEFANSAGFDGIELQGRSDWRERLDDLKAAQERGVVFSSICMIYERFVGDFEAGRRRDAIEHMKSLLSGIAELGGTGAITPAAYGLASKRLPPFEVPRSEDEDRRVLLDALSELGEHAEREGALVLLELLNRYEDHMLNRLGQALELCKTVDQDSVKVMGDLFHMNIEEDSLADSIRRTDGYLAHLHLADSNRLQPGPAIPTSLRPSRRCARSDSTVTSRWSAGSHAMPGPYSPRSYSTSERRLDERSCLLEILAGGPP